MQRIALTFTLFSYIVSLSYAIAYDFEHFKLKGALKTLNIYSNNMDNIPQRSSKDTKGRANIVLAKQEVARKLLDLHEVGNLSTKGFGVKSVNDSQERYSLIFKKVKELIGNNAQSIGDEETLPLILQHDIGGGVKNFSGFSWHRPQANFLLHANRELTPDLFSNKWIVHDTLVITLDATTILTNMADADLIEVSDEVIAAYAGMGLQRAYHFWHFADSYVAGLKADYTKLFLSFTYFSPDKIIALNDYEILKRNDQFYTNVGGLVNSPPYYGISFKGGVIANTSFTNNLTIQKLGENDKKNNQEFLRVSNDKNYKVGADITMRLQVDFFNLLKLSLLSYDLSYQYAESKKTHLSFYEKDKMNLLTRSLPGYNEFKNFITYSNSEINFWEKNIVQNDERIKQNFNSEYSVLLFGTLRKKSTEQIKVLKDNVEKYFYRNYSSSIKMIQNFWSRIFGTILYKLFDFNLPTKNTAETSKFMELEYEKQHHLDENIVDDEEKLSLVLTQKFYASKTHHWYHKLYRKQSINYLKKFTNIDSNIINLIKSSDLRGPLQITANYRIEEHAIRYFNQLSTDQVFSILVKVCGSNKYQKWTNERLRLKELSKFQFGSNSCVKKIGIRYLNYINKYHNVGHIDLNRFKLFIGSLFKKINSFKYLESIFHKENIFINGDFYATTKEGALFQTYFKSGQFRGLGVIDSFMRKGTTVIPIPIRD